MLKQISGYIKKKGTGFLKKTFIIGASSVVLNSCLIQYKLNPYSMVPLQGNSMSPTAENGDLILICRFCNLNVGDIVQIEDNSLKKVNTKIYKALHIQDEADVTREELYIKRIAALGGQPIPKYSEYLWDKTREPHVVKLIANMLASPPIIVPKKHLWVLGDNSLNSIDSRFWGSISESKIEGKVILIIKIKSFMPKLISVLYHLNNGMQLVILFTHLISYSCLVLIFGLRR